MKKSTIISLIMLLLCAIPITAKSQHSFTLIQDSIIYVAVDTASSGDIYDDGGPTANYSNSFWGAVILMAPIGDTIVLTGQVVMDNQTYSNDYVYFYADSAIFAYGTQSVNIVTTSGYLQISLYSDNDFSEAGCQLHYEVHPSTCSNPIGSMRMAWIGGTQAQLNWDSRMWADDFAILYSGNEGIVSNSSGYLLTNLQRSTTYQVTVASTSDTADADCLNTLTFTTDSCDEHITTFSVIDAGPTYLRLEWESTEGIGPYRLQWPGHDTTITENSVTLNNLTPNTSYTFVVNSMADPGFESCYRTLTTSTPCFKARVSGLHTLIGNDVATLTADSADAYLWSTGETTRSIQVTQPGYYKLTVFTNGGCQDTLLVGVSNVELDIDLDIPSDICSGTGLDIHVGMSPNANVRVNPNEVATMGDPTRIFLPDGVDCDPTSDHGCSYRSGLEFNGFGNHQLMTDENDIRYVMLNIEHSYIGDLYVNITCPNGKSADVLRFSGLGSSLCTQSIDATHRQWSDGNNCSGCYLGEPIDLEDNSAPCDSTAYDNRAGTGWRYCWSNNHNAGFSYANGGGLIYRRSNTVPGSSSQDSSNVAAGTNFYHPDQSFESLLGCPMNGNWYIEVIDGWGSDNGYIFGWELALDPAKLMRNTYSPSVDYAQLQGRYITRLNDTTFHVEPPANLSHDTTVNYTVTIIDDDGNTFDTTFTINFHPQRQRHFTRYVAENDLPVVAYGQTFTEEVSNYVITVPMNDGCDSTIYFTLSIARNTYANFDSTICSNMLPLSWDGQIFTQSEVRQVVIPNHAGADSLITYTLTVMPWEQAQINGARMIIGNNDMVVLTAAPATSYLWSTGATTQSINVNTPGRYTLVVNPTWECSDTTFVWIDKVIPTIDVNVPPTLCPGETANITVGIDEDAEVRVSGQETSLSDGQRIFLPDGQNCDPTSDHGCSYRSELVFDAFNDDQTITSASDILFVRLNIEHSYIADLYVNITCPNGQNADILRFLGSGTSSCTSEIGSEHRGWNSGNNLNSAFFGDAYDYEASTDGCDSTLPNNAPGIGWNYCWSNNNSQGYTYASDGAFVYRSSNIHDNKVDSSNVALGTQFYHPDDSFDSLIGCPLNGTWYIEVIDGWGSDNGYIFGWELALDPGLLYDRSYHPAITSADMVGPYQSRVNDTTFSITAPWHLTDDSTANYFVTIHDSTGASFDTSFAITFLTSPRRTVYESVVENAMPVTRFGRVFTTAVENEEILVPATTGCDSIITYNLEVIPNVFVDLYDSICPSSLPYTWNGITFTSAGNQQSVLATSRGADSVITMHLFVKANSYAVYNDTCVENSLPRHYLGLTAYNDVQGQGWSTTIPNTIGCDSIITYYLKVWHNVSTLLDTAICDDMLATFQWNSQSSTLTPQPAHAVTKTVMHDTLRHTLATAHGADSVVTLCLSVHPSYDLTFTGSTCANTPYYFEGQYYAVNGIYTHTFATAGTPQCDSLRTISLTVFDTSRYDTTVVACDQFTWEGNTYTSSTEAMVLGQYTNILGCDSTLALHLTVNYAHPAQYFDTCVENQLPRTYHHIVSQSDTVGAIDLLTTTQGCDSLVTYSLHVWRNHASTSDTLICDNQLANFVWHGQHSLLAPFDGTVVGVNNPDLLDTLHATIPTVHGADSNMTLHLRVAPSYHYDFYDTTCSNLPYTFEHASYDSTGVYTVDYHTFTSRCDSVLTLHLMVHPAYFFNQYDTIFQGQSVEFQGATYTATGVYQAPYNTIEGCDSIYTLHLTAKPLFNKNILDSICEGGKYIFSGDTLTAAGIYYDTIPAVNPSDGDTVIVLTLDVLPRPVVSLSLVDSSCSPTYYVLKGASSVPFLQWNSVPYDASLDGHEHDSVVTVDPKANTMYYLMTDYNEDGFCPQQDSIVVNPIEPVHAIIDATPASITLEDREVVALNISTGSVKSHRWGVLYDGIISFIDSMPKLELTVPNYVDTTCIWLMVKSRTCADTDTVCVPVMKSGLFIPNIFTPNLSTNNVFKVIGMGVIDFEIWIYDRRGSLVYHSNDIHEGWDGTSDGTPCAQASYVYKVRYSDVVTPGGHQVTSGVVTLVK